MSAEKQRVQEATLTFTYDEMTDSTTTGTIDFATGAIPAGALILGWKAVASAGFTGDTSAVIQVGVSGDLDRFSAQTTGSVFAAGTVGSLAIAADAADGISAAVTPRVTITTAADFTSVDGGAATVSIYYIETV